MTKLRDLTPSEGYGRSYKKAGNEYQPVSQSIYNLRELAQRDESELQLRVFEDEDFVVPPKDNGRSLVKAKIGKLYIEYTPGGKESFTLNIKFIDKQHRTLRSFLSLENPRYASLEFEDLLPFSLDAYYGSRTIFQPYDPGAPECKSHAYELKTVLTKLFLDEDITANDVQNFQEHYYSLYIENPAQPGRQSAPVRTESVGHQVPEPVKDIEHFGRHLEDKPASLFEVSVKLGAIALLNLSISEEEVGDVLREYLEISNKTPEIFQDTNVQETILNTLIDKGRLPLKAMVNDIESTLQNAISNLTVTATATKSTTRFNIVENAFTGKNGREIDQWLQNRLPKNLNIKERKKAYIEELTQQVKNLVPEQKKELALYVLNEKDHFLKKERHFFRSNTYSNQTFSVHQLVKTLMQGEQNNAKITIQDDEHDKTHVLSRHVN
ncbi:hypothetical protein [Legionella brunensis]|uniref:Uncharacterized protein n=1 Tax=Legionella brunensis TaxID=29422 RepID=A0A0W0S518_9GAMM|nr:hypothetical protein [Legionella brunensis]KTC78193.1 hypothetical protein Lbru_2485 [Legionella brunensis]